MKQFIKTTAFIFVIFVLFQSYALSQNIETQDHCANLTKIDSIPYKPADADKNDPMYKEYFILLSKGENAIPCLIENIANKGEMDDPRCPGVGVIAVGDLAYFILQDIARFNFTEMFPDEMQNAYKINGIYGYFDFIDKNGNRLKLQTKLKEWYSSKNQIKKYFLF